jgi:hypothetical protein
MRTPICDPLVINSGVIAAAVAAAWVLACVIGAIYALAGQT